jgi:hypothetical protein
MEHEVVSALVINASLVLLVCGPFLLTARHLLVSRGWPMVVVTSMALGCSLQAVMGLFWIHTLGRWPSVEPVVYIFVGLISFVWVRRRHIGHPSILGVYHERQPYLLLAVILAAAFLVRILHPLEVAYLGQSDAYTHLQYLRNIVEKGYLDNPAYPPGYHWILSLPVFVFHLDPYEVARYGGAFFGTGLVLAVFVLVEQRYNRRAAYITGCVAAAFPPMNLLMKTGVGVFANQLGLFLIPVIVLLYLEYVDGEKIPSTARNVLLIVLCGLSAAVPMMLLHLIVVIVLHRFFTVIPFSRRWLHKTLGSAVVLSVALMILVFHMTNIGPRQRVHTATAMTGFAEKTASPRVEAYLEKVAVPGVGKSASADLSTYILKSPYFSLVVDYFAIKRDGYGNPYINAMGLILVLMFIGLLGFGLRLGDDFLRFLGIWGALTSVQAFWGVLQFSSYQREGWSLLLAVCCLCGIVGAWVMGHIPRILFPRLLVALFFGLSAVFVAYHPPGHEAIWSSGEDMLVRSVRFLGETPEIMRAHCEKEDEKICEVVSILEADKPITIVTRRFSGWSNQGEIVSNVLPLASDRAHLIVSDTGEKNLFHTGGQYVALIDHMEPLAGQQIISAFAMVTPELVEATLRQRESLYESNKIILDQLDLLSPHNWQIHLTKLSENLSAYVVTPGES